MKEINPTVKAKIIKDIEKTGFISELKMVSLLIEKGWKTRHSETYTDKDENKSREIDIVATKTHYTSEIGFRLEIDLVIEVKKSEKMWIIFSTEREDMTLGWRIMHRSTNDRIRRNNNFMFPIIGPDCIDSKSPRENIEYIGKAFHEFGKKPSDKSNIYGALMNVGKASMYYKDRFGQEEDKDFRPEDTTDIIFYLPIVILDGNLFEVHLMNDNEVNVQPKNYVPLELSYSSPNYKEGSFAPDIFPDIVTFEGVSEYLDKVENWRTAMISIMIEKLQAAGKKARKL